MSIYHPGKCDRAGEMVEALTRAGGFSFGSIGIVDCHTGQIVSNWCSERKSKNGELQSDKCLRDLSRALRETFALSGEQVRLGLKGDLVHHRSFKATANNSPSRLRIGIGSRVGRIASVAAFSIDDCDMGIRKRQKVLFEIGLTYAKQVLRQHLDSSKEMRELGIQDSILQSISSGLAAVDRNGFIQYINTKALDWLDGNQEVCLINGRITSETLVTKTLLKKSIVKATSGPGSPSIIRVQGLEESFKTIAVLPISKVHKIALLVFSDKSSGGAQISEHLLSALGLTMAERKLAGRLLQGRTLAEAAAESNLTISTARSYLKTIFSKTGIHRQSELIALYYKLLPPIQLGVFEGLTAPSPNPRRRCPHSLLDAPNVITE